MQPLRTRTGLALLLAATWTLPALATSPPAPGPDPEKVQARLQEAAQRLKLTDAQKGQLKPIVEEHVAKARAVRDKYPAEVSRHDRRAMFEELRAARGDYDTKVRAILTPEQQKEWERMRDEARVRLREQMRDRRDTAAAPTSG